MLLVRRAFRSDVSAQTGLNFPCFYGNLLFKLKVCNNTWSCLQSVLKRMHVNGKQVVRFSVKGEPLCTFLVPYIPFKSMFLALFKGYPAIYTLSSSL